MIAIRQMKPDLHYKAVYSLDKALYDVSNLKGFIIHIYNQDSQKASEDFTKWLNKNGDSNVW